MREFPELDRVAWFSVADARTKLLKGQVGFLDRLMDDPELVGLRES
jgi:predicted NUDIX family NTP pyrophosphohydrolase